MAFFNHNFTFIAGLRSRIFLNFGTLEDILALRFFGLFRISMSGESMSKKTIAYVMSTNYAGSHFLSLLLGSNSRAMHIGEIKHLRKKKINPKRTLCYICKDASSCVMTRGITPENIDAVYDIIFSNISAVKPGVNTLVDTSKKTFWSERFLGNEKYDLKFIHLIRDPRAIVRRYIINNKTLIERLKQRWKVIRHYFNMAHTLLFAEQSIVYLYQWLKENIEISDFIETHRLNATVVTYRDLAKNTHEELKRLTEWLGLKYEPSQLKYFNFEHHGTQKPEYEWVKSSKRTDHIDLRWQTFLSEKTASNIVNDGLVDDYLSRLGLAFTEDGITKKINLIERKAV